LAPVGFTVGADVGIGVGAALQKPTASTDILGKLDLVKQRGKQVNLLLLSWIIASFGKRQREKGKEPSNLFWFKNRLDKAVSPPRDEGKEPTK
jgi:hypothetical protein